MNSKNTSLLYPFFDSAFPINSSISTSIAEGVYRLAKKLSGFSTESIAISSYMKHYFGGYVQYLSGTLQRYSYLLKLAIGELNLPLENMVFLDYGGGSGILSLLAKEVGIGFVAFNDFYESSCQDARLIAQHLNLEADIYISGDIDQVIQTFKREGIKQCTSIASYDVIEHIYNIDYFLSHVTELMAPRSLMVMQTTANPRNPFINYQRKKYQKLLEYHDRTGDSGNKESDSLKAYFTLRQEIIKEYAQGQLNDREVVNLSKATRGLRIDDIQKIVDDYLKFKTIPQPLSHPTNTCDPLTGNWAEHLLNPAYFVKMLEKQKLSVEILSGYYSDGKNRNINHFKKILNYLIYISKQKFLNISSSYIVYALKQ